MSKKKEEEEKAKKLKKKEEINKILRNADAGKEMQLGMHTRDFSFLDGVEEKFAKDLQNPDESYRLYYSIRRLLMEYLPKGKENEKARELVYEQKNIFLNRGKAKGPDGYRGSDGRQAYISSDLVVALEIVKDWIKSGANSFDIYNQFNEKNIELGYIDPKKQ
ncbi:hypothetical protein QYS48_05225 [Marivirga arenosa]|jgi:hypothetical protein|uniref:Uncharacterized protein n=1 Tax=Marivirga arenosa TaxID=3059076 RepID=A0AA49GGZ0_9BACT|nr:hypothetical protein [Marivirga sp. ABR2-2]WKK86368.2 hypothetical protein QYS48_05225 [Marivirga sp. ABR2-2]